MNIMSQRIFLIRHGEGFHNVNYHLFGKGAYYVEKYMDPKLTNKGKDQALELGETWIGKEEIDLIITSPLTRCLETTTNIFKDMSVPIIANENIREFPMGLQYSNKRRDKWILQNEFPHISFNDVLSSSDEIWNNKRYETMDELNERKRKTLEFIKHRPEKNIALVSHSSFIMNFLFNFVDEDEDKELKHCYPYEFKMEDIDFGTRKESSYGL